MHYVLAKGILSAENRMNLYRGCTHGCIYCDSRSSCYHMDHDFQDVEVKENALILLENTLKRKHKKCMIGMGSMSDPYLPLEMELQYTRRALELIGKYGFGCGVLTKSANVLRDLDLFTKIHSQTKCVVQMTLTTYDDKLCRILEPHVSETSKRADALKKLRDNDIPAIVWLGPILPFINDTEENLLGVLDLCYEAGVAGIVNFGMGVTLREGNRDYFYAKLDEHFPGMKERYISAYGSSYVVNSFQAPALQSLFQTYCREHDIESDVNTLFDYMGRFEEKGKQKQMSVFDF
ncbi:radical SAM protein [Methanocorpusculum sp. GPch4]|uniref:SPL family radical SAM protein n=1 Tax=Methanocorpusculum sp. GPch4 TaxID=2527877 RepID=UPI0014332C92|nr:radical SAM protein [Methanocorpusculum sp. GPch4]